MFRVSGIFNHMKTQGENVSNETVVSKVLRSLPKGFDHVVVAIEESKYLSTYNFDELMSSLLAHKVWISRSYEKVEEKALQAKGSLFTKENQNIRVAEAEEEVVIEVEVVATAEEEASLVTNVKTETTFCMDIARSWATQKLIVGPSRVMTKNKQISQRKLKRGVSYL